MLICSYDNQDIAGVSAPVISHEHNSLQNKLKKEVK